MTGNLTTSQLPRIGLAGLEQGLDSESLIILAGMNEKDNPFQLEDYFRRSLAELKIVLPDKRTAALELALYYADEILEGRVDPVDGVRSIIRNALGSYNFSQETKKYAMDSIGFSKVYGLYWYYDDLLDADRPWSDGKSNEELMREAKHQLVKEIFDWRKTAYNAG